MCMFRFWNQFHLRLHNALVSPSPCDTTCNLSHIIASRNSDSLESGHYAPRYADYAWQLLVASGAIVVRFVERCLELMELNI